MYIKLMFLALSSFFLSFCSFAYPKVIHCKSTKQTLTPSGIKPSIQVHIYNQTNPNSSLESSAEVMLGFANGEHITYREVISIAYGNGYESERSYSHPNFTFIFGLNGRPKAVLSLDTAYFQSVAPEEEISMKAKQLGYMTFELDC